MTVPEETRFEDEFDVTEKLENETNELPEVSEDSLLDAYKNYNIPFEDDPDVSKSCSKRLHLMSIERDEIEANVHFGRLVKADWSPKLKVRFILFVLCNNVKVWACIRVVCVAGSVRIYLDNLFY